MSEITELLDRFLELHGQLPGIRTPTTYYDRGTEYVELRQKIITALRVLDEAPKWLKEIQDREENNRNGDIEREEVRHNCFQDGRKSGYLWCVTELEHRIQSLSNQAKGEKL